MKNILISVLAAAIATSGITSHATTIDEKQQALIEFIAQEERTVSDEQQKINALSEMVQNAEKSVAGNYTMRIPGRVASAIGVWGEVLSIVMKMLDQYSQSAEGQKSFRGHIVIFGIILAAGVITWSANEYKIVVAEMEMKKLQSQIKIVQLTMENRLEALNALKQRVGIDLNGIELTGVNVAPTAPLIIPSQQEQKR